MPRSLVSACISLGFPRKLRTQYYSGFLARAIFYELLSRINPQLSQELHNQRQLAGFSISPIMIRHRHGELRPAYHLIPGPSSGLLRITLLDPALQSKFAQLIMAGLDSIRIQDIPVPVTQISVSQLEYAKLIPEQIPPDSKLKLHFVTPTVFRESLYRCCIHCPCYIQYKSRIFKLGVQSSPCEYLKPRSRGSLLPLPIPLQLFRSLARIWRKFSDFQLDLEGLLAWIQEGGIRISGLSLSTMRLYEHRTTNKWVIGFRGWVNLDLGSRFDPKHIKTAYALLRLGEYSGVGVNRTAGFGIIQPKLSSV